MKQKKNMRNNQQETILFLVVYTVCFVCNGRYRPLMPRFVGVRTYQTCCVCRVVDVPVLVSVPVVVECMRSSSLVKKALRSDKIRTVKRFGR